MSQRRDMHTERSMPSVFREDIYNVYEDREYATVKTMPYKVIFYERKE